MCPNCVDAPPRARVKLGLATLPLAALLLVGCGSAPSQPEPQASVAAEAVEPAAEPLPAEAVQQFDAAVLHMNAGDAAAAEKAFAALAQAYPTYSGALVNLGLLLAKQNRLAEAEQALRSAVERNAQNAAAHNQLGIVYRKLGRFGDADASYQRAVEIDPNYALAWLNLGVLCDLYLQQPERALSAFERYLELAASPDDRVKTWVSELKRRVGAPDDPRAARVEK